MASVSKLSAAAAAKSLQLCLTLCDRMDCSLSGSSIHGSFQAKVLSGLPLPSLQNCLCAI